MGRSAIPKDEFLYRLSNKFGNKFTLIDDYIDMRTKIHILCNDCKTVLYIKPEKLLASKHGCSQCFIISMSMPTLGVNDLWTTYPSIAKYLKNKDDGYKYSYGSSKKIWFKCPICGYEEERIVQVVVRDGFSCRNCSDGISYPNKFFRNMLTQLCVDYIPEWSPDFIKPMAYDFYFEKNGCQYIIEADGGLGHGKQRITSKSKYTKEESIARDQYKDNLASKNNVIVVRIDCDYPTVDNRCEFIKNNVVNSILADIFDLSVINWMDCDRFATSSLVYKVADLWNSGIHTAKEIAENLKLTKTCVISYLKKSEEFGISSYNHNEYVRQMRMEANKITIATTSIPVQCIETQEIFSSMAKANRTYHCLVGKYFSGECHYAGKLLDGTKLHWIKLLPNHNGNDAIDCRT